MFFRKIAISVAVINCFCLVSSSVALAGSDWRSPGSVTAVHPLPNGAEFASGTIHLRVTVLSPNVVRLRYTPTGDFPPDHSFAVVSGAFPEGAKFEARHDATSQIVETAALRVRVNQSTLGVSFEDKATGVVIQQDQAGFPVTWNDKEFRVWKAMPADEHYFALGDKSGPLDHRNLAFTMWNTDAYGWGESTDPLYKSIPFLMGVRAGRAWGLFLDNTYRSFWDLGKSSRDAFSFGADDGPLDYYFFYGPLPKRVVEDFTQLTGRTPLPPLFAMGYQQSRYSYFPESRVRQIANEYRARKIPLDALYLDIDYQNGNRPFTVDTKGFPDFNGLLHDLTAEGIKPITILDLHVKKEVGYAPYDSGHAGDHFIKAADGGEYVGKVWPGDSVFPDFTQAQTREWWGGLYKDFKDRGVRGFWNDMNEPAVFNATKTMPLDAVHRIDDGGLVRTTDHREIHNVLGMENDRATFEGLLKLRPNERPFVLTRAAYAGTQRYAATWTGDNSSSWNHMEISVPQVLNLGLSGYAMSGVDVGGYKGNPSPELLTRWMQLGAFYPMYRNHAEKSSRDREPWVDGPEHEAIRKKFIELRYRLLPYTYTQMEETTRTGVPLMRAMFLEFPDDAVLATEDKEFMFGSGLLVAPALSDEVRGYTVSLPHGVWYNYWTGAKVEGEHPVSNTGDVAGGGGVLSVTPALSELPVYVRGGAIIPQQAVVQHVEEVPAGPLELRIYPGFPKCEGSLYLDDGNTFGYQHGQYFRQAFTCSGSAEASGGVRAESITLNLLPSEGSFQPWFHEVTAVFMGFSQNPASVRVNGQAMNDWKFDPAQHSISVTIPWVPTGGKVEVSTSERLN